MEEKVRVGAIHTVENREGGELFMLFINRRGSKRESSRDVVFLRRKRRGQATSIFETHGRKKMSSAQLYFLSMTSWGGGGGETAVSPTMINIAGGRIYNSSPRGGGGKEWGEKCLFIIQGPKRRGRRKNTNVRLQSRRREKMLKPRFGRKGRGKMSSTTDVAEKEKRSTLAVSL